MSNETIGRIADTFPALHPDELEKFRRLSGRADLTNEEAQLLLREITIWEAFLDFEEKGHGPLR